MRSLHHFDTSKQIASIILYDALRYVCESFDFANDVSSRTILVSIRAHKSTSVYTLTQTYCLQLLYVRARGIESEVLLIDAG